MAPEDPTEIVDAVADRVAAADAEQADVERAGAEPADATDAEATDADAATEGEAAPEPDDDEDDDDSDGATERDGAAEVRAWKARVASAAISPRAHDALSDARAHLDAAWQASDAGTESAPAGKLRHAHKAALVGMRHVTSHQVPFNRELVVAVDRLTRVVEELATRLEVVDELEERYDGTLQRARAGVATIGVQVDDMAGELAEVADAVADLTARLEAVERGLADQRQLVGATRAREDLVLRTLRDASATAADAPIGALAGEADTALVRRLAAAGRPRPEVVVGWARLLEPVVAAAAAGAPVVDLDSGRGEWLDVWATLDGPARGTESDPAAADLLRERGHEIATGAPAPLLASLPAGSVGAVTAVALADVRPLAELVAVVDAAVAVLRPGGVLVLAAADPAGAPTDVLWADPRRRPLHPDTLTLLALERGFAEAEVVDLVAAGAPEDGGPRAYALVARAPGGAPPV